MKHLYCFYSELPIYVLISFFSYWDTHHLLLIFKDYLRIWVLTYAVQVPNQIPNLEFPFVLGFSTQELFILPDRNYQPSSVVSTYSVTSNLYKMFTNIFFYHFSDLFCFYI